MRRLGELVSGHFLLLARRGVRTRCALHVALDTQRAILVARGACRVRGGAATRAAPLRAGAAVEEQLDTLEATGAASRQQREVAVAVVGRVRVGLGTEQPLDDAVVGEACGHGEQPRAVLRARLALDALAARLAQPLLTRAESGVGLVGAGSCGGSGSPEYPGV